MMVTVVFVYSLCWLPFNILLVRIFHTIYFCPILINNNKCDQLNSMFFFVVEIIYENILKLTIEKLQLDFYLKEKALFCLSQILNRVLNDD